MSHKCAYMVNCGQNCLLKKGHSLKSEDLHWSPCWSLHICSYCINMNLYHVRVSTLNMEGASTTNYELRTTSLLWTPLVLLTQLQSPSPSRTDPVSHTPGAKEAWHNKRQNIQWSAVHTRIFRQKRGALPSGCCVRVRWRALFTISDWFAFFTVTFLVRLLELLQFLTTAALRLCRYSFRLLRKRIYELWTAQIIFDSHEHRLFWS